MGRWEPEGLPESDCDVGQSGFDLRGGRLASFASFPL